MRLGITLPLEGLPLHAHSEWIAGLPALGFTDVWTSEVAGSDAFVPLACVAQLAPDMTLGTAAAPVFTRGPATLATTVATLADLAPGRFVCGIGSSSVVITKGWNAIDFHDPVGRVRDVLRFLRKALSGEKISESFASFDIEGFRLSRIPEVLPPIYVAALRRKMLELAGAEADGVILNWLSSGDLSSVLPYVHKEDPTKEVVARLFVVPTADAGLARSVGRRAIAAYLNVPTYAAFHKWLGRAEPLEQMWNKWSRGDRAGALEAISDDVVDDLVVHGPPEACVAHVKEYVEKGVGVPVLDLLPGSGIDPREAFQALGRAWLAAA